MSDGIAAVRARMAHLDQLLSGFSAMPAASFGVVGWQASSFGSALAAAGGTSASPAAASGAVAVSPTPAGDVAASATVAGAGTAIGADASGAVAAAVGLAAPNAVQAATPSASSTAASLATFEAAGPPVASAAEAAGTPSGPLFPLAVAPAAPPAAPAATVTPGGAGGGAPAGATAPSGGATAGLRFVSPLADGHLTQAFGPTDLGVEPSGVLDGQRYAHLHAGIDLAAAEGTPVTAAGDGVVILAGRVQDGAVDVIIRHASGVETLYGHLEPRLKVHVGQKVKAGDVLGRVGMTGNTTGPHLHFSLTRGGVPMDPSPYLASGHLPGLDGPPGAGLVPASWSAADQASTDTLPEAFAAFDKVADSIPYAAEIRDAARRAGIPPLLLAGLVKYESGFRADAKSSVGAMGLTQLMPATARSLGVTDPYDPVQNLRAGARYLASNLRLYGRADLALAAYQSGRGTVKAAGGMPASATTQHYAAGIIKAWRHWTRLGAA